MKRSSSVFVAFSALLVVFAYATTTPKPENGFDCEAAKRSLKPCIPYLTGSGDHNPVPTKQCCIGVKEVKSSAPTKEEQRAACKCLKEAVTHLPNFNESRANSLTSFCIRDDVLFTMSKKLDCSK
ncbi:hypothetical protein Fmac_030726 [Flemingia macrophylla]|uniref:Bifunctional inhibitor/plant lipid transfer protein/seed storage helical domain-containing protein n=1 Tax=Flemingia macrophylla TaxID=520843 RepID=A0ABD1L1B4_9FABA